MSTSNLELASKVVDQLKKQYGAVFEVSAQHPDTGETHTFIVRRPSLKEMDMFTAMQAKGQLISGMAALAYAICVDGDKDKMLDDALFPCLMPYINQVLEIRQGSLKKL